MSAADDLTAPRVRKPWPKVHLIYFLLAAFDLLAVGGGLYLSHRLIQVFEANTAANAEWDARFNSSWTLVDTAADANRALIGAFENGNIALASRQFRTKVYEFRQELAAFSKYVDGRFPPGLVKRTNTLLLKLGTLMASMEAEGQAIIGQFNSGDRDAAVKALAAMQTRYGNLRFLVNDLNRLVSLVKTAHADENKATVEKLRVYEYVIGGMIVLMVCCVVVYGHWIGRLMKSKYHELEASNDDLHRAQAESMAFATQVQAINDEVTKLNRELADNVRKLEAAQDEIIRRGKLSQLGQLTATVAHELRNPLATVRTSVFLVERKIQDKVAGLDAQFRRIENGITRCDATITQLLDFARSKALQREDIDVDEWLAQVVEEQAQKLPPSVRIECSLGLGGRTASIDSERMSRVMINLLTNASEAMVGRGDDPSKVTTPDPLIAIETRLAARGIEISVSDKGPGMSEEVMNRILEPLFTTKNFGTGLGLPAVEKILEQHGGGLEVKSEPGKGARFTVWFPSEAEDRQAA
jgi:signal transduction histidine kinase